MNIGANIKKFRKEKGLTQQQLADLIKKSKPIVQKYESNDVSLNIRTYQKYESGEIEPKLGTLEQIAEVLEVSISDLIGDTQVHVIEKDITQFTTEELLKELYRRTIK